MIVSVIVIFRNIFFFSMICYYKSMSLSYWSNQNSISASLAKASQSLHAIPSFRCM